MGLHPLLVVAKWDDEREARGKASIRAIIMDLCTLSQEETFSIKGFKHYPTKAQKVVAVTRGSSQVSGIEQCLPDQAEVSFTTRKPTLCMHLQLPKCHKPS